RRIAARLRQDAGGHPRRTAVGREVLVLATAAVRAGDDDLRIDRVYRDGGFVAADGQWALALDRRGHRHGGNAGSRRENRIVLVAVVILAQRRQLDFAVLHQPAIAVVELEVDLAGVQVGQRRALARVFLALQHLEECGNPTQILVVFRQQIDAFARKRIVPVIPWTVFGQTRVVDALVGPSRLFNPDRRFFVLRDGQPWPEKRHQARQQPYQAEGAIV